MTAYFVVRKVPFRAREGAIQVRYPVTRPHRHHEIAGTIDLYMMVPPAGGVEWSKNADDATQWSDPWEPHLLARARGGKVYRWDEDGTVTEIETCKYKSPKKPGNISSRAKEW